MRNLVKVSASLLAVASGLGLVSPLSAQELGDPARGHRLASRVCGECHAVLADDTNSRNPKATPFVIFAQIPGLTERAIAAFLQTPHKDMPNLVLSRPEQDDIIAYIMSLKRKP